MKLSKNFWLKEFIKSETAIRKGIDNTPNRQITIALMKLVRYILQPLRDSYNKTVVINSGYRSPKLNKAIGGSSKSQHCKGEAADIEIPGVDNLEVAKWIAINTSFDQLILEFYEKGKPESGWVHVSYKDKKQNREQILRAIKKAGKTKYYSINLEYLLGL